MIQIKSASLSGFDPSSVIGDSYMQNQPSPAPFTDASAPSWYDDNAKTIWGLLATASAAASSYHGYRRNKSVGWGVAWFVLGLCFPIITPTIALAQGFGKVKS
jgi:hypothetical protein